MNRLLNVFQNAAIAEVSKQNFLSTVRNPNSVPSFRFLAAFVPGSWFSTAVATPGDELQQNAAEAASPPIAQPSRGQQQSASAGSPFAASTPTPSSPACAAHAQTANLAAAQPQPQEQEDPPPVVPVFEDDALAAQLQQPQSVQLLQVVPTPDGAPRDKLLVRDFIQNSLYHPTLGYFSAPTPPVGSVGSPINYWRIYCRDEFNILVNKKYQELESSFLTPAELFSPWYGACIARHMVEHRRHHLAMEGQPLLIVEVGGGNGTLARDILDWLRDNRPQDYRLTSYTCLEISTSLAARQYDKVVRQGGHGGRFHLRRGSGLDPATWGSERRWEHTFVLMMEVLDNLPHDRVFRRRPSDPWQQSVVRPVGTTTATTATASRPATSSTSTSHGAASLERGPWEMAGEPLADPLLCRTLAAVYRTPSREQQLDERFNRVLDFILARDSQPSSRDEVLWLPTACAAFLELLHTLRPNHSLIAADFDKLPDVKLPGRNAPLVAQKAGGRNIDHDTLFVPWGTADIFFPTDFDALCALYRATAQHVWGGGGGGGGDHHHHHHQQQQQQQQQQQPDTAAAGGDPLTMGTLPPPPPAPPPPGHAASGSQGVGVDGGCAVGDVNAEHFRQGAVIKRYREMFNTATICAFNPMVDDFVNARFFFGDSKNRLPPGQERPAPQASKSRMPQAPPSLASGIKAHIPAASAAKVRARLQQQQHQHPLNYHQQQQQQQQQERVTGLPKSEPVLGGRRHRGSPGNSSSSSNSTNSASSDSTNSSSSSNNSVSSNSNSGGSSSGRGHRR